MNPLNRFRIVNVDRIVQIEDSPQHPAGFHARQNLLRCGKRLVFPAAPQEPENIFEFPGRADQLVKLNPDIRHFQSGKRQF